MNMSVCEHNPIKKARGDCNWLKTGSCTTFKKKSSFLDPYGNFKIILKSQKSENFYVESSVKLRVWTSFSK